MEGAREEQHYLLERLEAGPVELPAFILDRIDRFEPLEFKPGQSAAEWLRVNAATGTLPLDTYLVFDETYSELLGFFVLDPIELRVSRGDTPIVEVRKRLEDTTAPLPAMKLVWIARSIHSPQGLGEELFDEVVMRAQDANTVAVVVEPYDDDTAKKLWEEHFHCRVPRDDPACPEWTKYRWYPVGKPNDLWG